MTGFELSKYCLEQMARRGLTTELVEAVLTTPDTIIEEGDGQQVYQAVLQKDGRDYLLRVFVNSNKVPGLVKTLYLTSKISKYQ